MLKEYVLGTESLTIGRHEGNSIQIDSMAVSSNHARIDFDDGGYLITDLGSTNGTFVNGKRISKATLKPNDWVSVGKHILTYKHGVSER